MKPPCKSWSCPICGEQNALFWRFRAAYGAEKFLSDGIPVDFVTLTSHEKLTPARSVEVFYHAWHTLHRRMSRAASGAREYLAVPEQHQSGKLHVHMLTTAILPKKWWKDNARGCGLGYMADVKHVTSAGQVAGYMTKYVTKSLEFQAWPKGFRRIRTSRGWPEPPAHEAATRWVWQTIGNSTALNELIAELTRVGYSVTL